MRVDGMSIRRIMSLRDPRGGGTTLVPDYHSASRGWLVSQKSPETGMENGLPVGARAAERTQSLTPGELGER